VSRTGLCALAQRNRQSATISNPRVSIPSESVGLGLFSVQRRFGPSSVIGLNLPAGLRLGLRFGLGLAAYFIRTFQAASSSSVSSSARSNASGPGK
jgi:hypothetical protein